MDQKRDPLWTHDELTGEAMLIEEHFIDSDFDVALCPYEFNLVPEELEGTYKKHKGASNSSSDTEVSL